MSHSSGEGYALSYERGAAIALWADTAIRIHSNSGSSLDNVMLDLIHQNETQNPAPEFTEERVLAAFSPYLSDDEMQQLRRMAICALNHKMAVQGSIKWHWCVRNPFEISCPIPADNLPFKHKLAPSTKEKDKVALSANWVATHPGPGKRAPKVASTGKATQH